MRLLRSALVRASVPLALFSLLVEGSARADTRLVFEPGASARLRDASTSLVRFGVDRFGDGERIERFGQTHHGLPVIGRGASVRFSASGKPIATVLDLESSLPSSTEPAVAAPSAARVASGRSPVAAAARDAHLVVWPTRDRGARLAYVVLPAVPAGLPTAPRVVVDAETGEVLEARDLVTYAKAKVYQFNPTTTPKLGLQDLAIAPDGAPLTNAFVTSFNCIDKRTVKAVSISGFDLNVHVCDLTQTATPDASGDYVYEPSDVAGSTEARSDTFSEVSMYYHASKAYGFFRDLQGDPSAQVVVDKPLRVIANLQIPQGIATGDLTKASDPNLPLDPFQNAFFAPAAGGLGALFQQLYGFEAGALWFGQGPKRDYSYDGDVIYHEFTHAVVDATLKLEAWHVDARGAIDAPGAMNEGLADYFSSAITGDPNVGEYASVDIGLPEGTALRTLDNQDTCATGLGGEVHLDSTVFSGALWTARTTLAAADRTRFDGALYKAMRASPGSSDLGYEDLGKLFLATLKTDFPAGATALEKAMTDRGLLPACERIATYAGTAVKARDPRIGFVAPGKQSVQVKGIAPGVVQVQAQIPDRTASVVVSFTARTSGAGGGGSGGLFGGGAKPFAPVVLGKLGSPITWDPKSSAGHDATLKVDAKIANGNASATLDLPEGTPAVALYVQIASTGDSDGSYDGITIDFTPLPGEDDAGAPDSGASAAAPSSSTTESGCAAAPSPSSAPGVLFFPGVLGALAFLAFRRRRRA